MCLLFVSASSLVGEGALKESFAKGAFQRTAGHESSTESLYAG